MCENICDSQRECFGVQNQPSDKPNENNNNYTHMELLDDFIRVVMINVRLKLKFVLKISFVYKSRMVRNTHAVVSF